MTDFSHSDKASGFESLIIGLCGGPTLPDTVRKTFDLGFSDGEPVAETLEDPVCRLGVLTMVTPPLPLLSDPEDDTRLMLMRSTLRICGIDSLFACLSRVDVMLAIELRLLPFEMMLKHTRLLLWPM
jgi:hypothetical protein